MKTDKEKEKGRKSEEAAAAALERREERRRRRRRMVTPRGIYGNKKIIVSLVRLCVRLRAALWILIYAFPLSSVPSSDFPRFPFLPTFSELAKRKGRDERRKERFVFSLSLSLSYLISFASIVRCISRVVECKLLRAWGWFTANWFVNVVFTPLETPIFLPFLGALGAHFGSRRELPGSVVTWPSFLTSSSRIKRPGRVWMVDFV